jgi:hypothetical protein
MPPFVEVGINLRSKGLNLEIMFICNKMSPTTLDVIAICVILHVKKILPFTILLL